MYSGVYMPGYTPLTWGGSQAFIVHKPRPQCEGRVTGPGTNRLIPESYMNLFSSHLLFLIILGYIIFSFLILSLQPPQLRLQILNLFKYVKSI